jgi:hypothetical protein
LHCCRGRGVLQPRLWLSRSLSHSLRLGTHGRAGAGFAKVGAFPVRGHPRHRLLPTCGHPIPCRPEARDGSPRPSCGTQEAMAESRGRRRLALCAAAALASFLAGFTAGKCARPRRLRPRPSPSPSPSPRASAGRWTRADTRVSQVLRELRPRLGADGQTTQAVLSPSPEVKKVIFMSQYEYCWAFLVLALGWPRQGCTLSPG